MSVRVTVELSNLKIVPVDVPKNVFGTVVVSSFNTFVNMIVPCAAVLDKHQG